MTSRPRAIPVTVDGAPLKLVEDRPNEAPRLAIPVTVDGAPLKLRAEQPRD